MRENDRLWIHAHRPCLQALPGWASLCTADRVALLPVTMVSPTGNRLSAASA